MWRGGPGRGGRNDSDKGFRGAASLAVTEKEESHMLERLHEVVQMLRPDQQELYYRIVIEEESMCEVAGVLGVDSSAIRHRMETIRKFIKKNF